MLVTEEMAEGLEEVNELEEGSRKVRARRLGDGRLIVNVDVLLDGGLEAWHAVLEGAVVVALSEADLSEEG